MQGSSAVLKFKKILIVDDDPIVVRTLSRVFEKLGGHQVSSASDGEEALQEIKRDSFDLIILDLQLPKVTGEEVCRQIKKNEKTKNIPIIMVSGKCREVDRIIGRVIGADYYMPKPCAISELLKAANDILEKNGNN